MDDVERGVGKGRGQKVGPGHGGEGERKVEGYGTGIQGVEGRVRKRDYKSHWASSFGWFSLSDGGIRSTGLIPIDGEKVTEVVIGKVPRYSIDFLAVRLNVIPFPLP